MLLEQISKLNCDGCKLKTEHYLVTDGDTLIDCHCLKCGQRNGAVQFVAESHESYPMDPSRPAYIL